MSEGTSSNSEDSELAVEEDQTCEKMDDNVPPPEKQVWNNDHLTHKILSFVHNPTDKCHAERVSRRWNFLANDYADHETTLYIVRVTMDFHSLVKWSFGNFSCTLRLHRDYLLKEQFDRIISQLSKMNAIEKIKRIIIRGSRSNIIEFTSLHVDESLAEFLDNFKSLRHLKLDLVFCFQSFLLSVPNYEFRDKIRSLFLPFSSRENHNLMTNLIGEKVEILYMFQETFFWFSIDETFWNPPFDRMRLVVYQEEQGQADMFASDDYLSEISKYNHDTWYFGNLGRYFEVEGYNVFTKELHLHEPSVPSIGHFQDLTKLKLCRFEESGDEDVTMQRISDVRKFSKLAELRIDGYFNKRHFRKLLWALKDCRTLTHFYAKIRNLSEEDWIWLIKRLPKHILCIKLVGLTSDKAITALKERLSKSLRNIEIVVWDNNLSTESFEKLLHGFRKLQFLKFRGINPRKPKYAKSLKFARIRTIEFIHGHRHPRLNGCYKIKKNRYISRQNKFVEKRRPSYSCTSSSDSE